MSLVLVQGLEDAKRALESETISVEQFRLRQGEAKAYRDTFNLVLALAKTDDAEESNNGKEHD
jgi:hypothetical protein